MRKAVMIGVGMWFLGPILSLEAAGLPTDPFRDCYLTPEVGPWVICVTSFRGDEAKELAEKLVAELRGHYRLPAYLYNRSNEDRERERQRLEVLRQKYGPDTPLKRVRILDEYAVLVGGYADMNEARKHAERIKKLDPPKQVPFSRGVMVPLEHTDKHDPRKIPGVVARTNPLATSFVVRNPLVPQPQEVDFDPLWLKLNADEPLSVLRCPKPWTVVVKVFRPPSVLESARKPSTVRTNNFFKPALPKMTPAKGESLEDYRLRASQLAARLRQPDMGYEAYVFHTRDASIVTVGACRDLKDPEIGNLQRLTAGHIFKVAEGQFEMLEEKPLPMQVPRAP
jgi:hypothetical protein